MIGTSQNTINHTTWRQIIRIAKYLFFILTGTLRWMKLLFLTVIHILWRLIKEIHAMELLFVNMSNIYTFLCQLLFLTMCEIVILGEPTQTSETEKTEQGITGLSALLLYNVFGYFVSKIKDIYQNDWPRLNHIHSSATHYAKWILKFLLEWAKAIAIILCIRDKEISCKLNLNYTLITFSYYIFTEKLFTELIIASLGYFDFRIFDSMEHLYVPIIFNIYTILCAAIIGTHMSVTSHFGYALFASYFILYLRTKDLYFTHIKELFLEKKTYASFRNANDKDLENWNDICAVCLNPMLKAKKTPCNHLFHPSCLKQCLRTSLKCPLCKRDFIR